MAKIFISYKYADSNVKSITSLNTRCTVRDYVDKIQEKIGVNHINKGENDGEDMSTLADSTIQSKLGDKIYDSTVTIVLISPNMKDNTKAENEQWIPWEISYSLREQSRNGRTSKTNAILAVVLPDYSGSYEYFMIEHTCQYCDCTTYKTATLFNILASNMFNKTNPTYTGCSHHDSFNKPHSGHFSYIHCVKWDNFIKNHEHYINIAKEIKDNITEYSITKNIK
ncbi:MAG: TIR domain-containing protein [Tannerellaceae bacterium]